LNARRDNGYRAEGDQINRSTAYRFGFGGAVAAISLGVIYLAAMGAHLLWRLIEAGWRLGGG
jgi:hypothetical protein